MKILLSNDDSVHARGIKVLFEQLKKEHDVVVVAPLEEKSTAGHSLTLHKPLRIHKLENNYYGVSGGPADCVLLGVHEILKFKPDFVVSGINRGANLGQDVFYSGTVSAAREALMLGVPSIAISLSLDFKNPRPEEHLHYHSAAEMALKVLRMKHLFHKIRRRYLLNINCPDLPLKKIKGLIAASQGFRKYSGRILKRKDHRGKDYFWVGGSYLGFEDMHGSDCNYVDQGYATITPHQLDTTDHLELHRWLQEWDMGRLPKENSLGHHKKNQPVKKPVKG